MNNWQLAILIARIVDGPHTPLFHGIIMETVLPTAQKQKDVELCMFLDSLLSGRNISEKRDHLEKLGKDDKKKESHHNFVISERNARGTK